VYAMHPELPHESATCEVERRIALLELAGTSVFTSEGLATLSSMSWRKVYEPGAKVEESREPMKILRVVLNGGLRIERNGYVWHQPAQGNVLSLLWLARDVMQRVVSTEQCVDVLELPIEGLEAVVEDEFAAWTAMTRRIARTLVEMPSAPATGGMKAGKELGDRLGALMHALPFARGYLEALLQLDEDAERVEVGPDAFPEDLPVRSLLVPLEEVVLLERDRLFGIGGVELLAGRPRAPSSTSEPQRPYAALRIDEESLFDVLEDNAPLARDLSAALASAAMRGRETLTT
jgi:hypothetical protein